jgi:hypothetical protein
LGGDQRRDCEFGVENDSEIASGGGH